MSPVAFAWDMNGRPTRHVPPPRSHCERCEEWPPAVFVLVPGADIAEWMCDECVADIQARGVEYHEVISAAAARRAYR